MSRSWRVISLVVLIAILFGAVCVGVGLVTGGEWDRIYSSLDARYHIDMYVDYIGQVFTVLRDAWVSPSAEVTPAPAPESAPEEIEPASDSFVVIPDDAAPTPVVTPAA